MQYLRIYTRALRQKIERDPERPVHILTAIGAGHRLLDRFIGLFARPTKPIAFDAIDGQPVQLVFVLLIPVEETFSHVAALAALSRRFRNGDVATNC